MKEHLDNDASDVGLGSVLSQREGERDVVIAYASRTMYKSERNYDVTKRELHAVVFGLHKYLCIRRFVGTWLNFIEEFQFDIEHTATLIDCRDDRLPCQIMVNCMYARQIACAPLQGLFRHRMQPSTRWRSFLYQRCN